MYQAMILAPVVYLVVPWILGFFFVLGVIANIKPSRRDTSGPVFKHNGYMTNEEIMKKYKG